MKTFTAFLAALPLVFVSLCAMAAQTPTPPPSNPPGSSPGNPSPPKPTVLCEKESVQAALATTIQYWNFDAPYVGTSIKATNVALKPGSEGAQGSFVNVVKLEISEASFGTLSTSMEVSIQRVGEDCYATALF